MRLFFIISLLIFSYQSYSKVENSGTSTAKAVVELQKDKDTNNPSFSLKDNWGFLHNKWINDTSEIPIDNFTTIDLSSNWPEFYKDSQQDDGSGTSTFFIKLVVDPSIKDPGLKLPPVFYDAEVLVNNQKLTDFRENTGAGHRNISRIFDLNYQENGVYHIVINLPYIDQSFSGIIGYPVFGSSESLLKKAKLNSYFNLFLIGSFLLVAVYLLGFYFFLSKKQLLYLGLICLSISIRMLTNQESVLYEWISLPWAWSLRFGYLTFYATALFFFLFTNAVFKGFLSRKFTFWITTVMVGFILLVIATPQNIFEYSLTPFHITFVSLSVYYLVRVSRLAYKGSLEARLFIGGTAVLYVTFINDVLVYRDLIYSVELLPIGLVFLILSVSLILPFYFSRVYKKVDQLKNSLAIQNKELKDINDELDKLMYVVSHDLKSPLLSIQGLINIARNETQNDRMLDIFNMKEKSINRLRAFIEDILNYSKNAMINVKPANVDYSHEISEILDGIEHTEEFKNIKKSVSIVQNRDFVTDIFRVKIILNNLISNAFKYHDKNKDESTVNIQVDVLEDKSLIEVKDNGIGIPKDQLNSIFNMFHRVEGVNVEGTGLGLFLVQDCVKALKGQIRIDSTEDEGTTFYIEIPNYCEADNDISNKLKKEERSDFTTYMKKYLAAVYF